MIEKYFKYVVAFFFVLSFLMILTSIFEKPRQYNVAVTEMLSADKGLDLKAVGEILQKSKRGKIKTFSRNGKFKKKIYKR